MASNLHRLLLVSALLLVTTHAYAGVGTSPLQKIPRSAYTEAGPVLEPALTETDKVMARWADECKQKAIAANGGAKPEKVDNYYFEVTYKVLLDDKHFFSVEALIEYFCASAHPGMEHLGFVFERSNGKRFDPRQLYKITESADKAAIKAKEESDQFRTHAGLTTGGFFNWCRSYRAPNCLGRDNVVKKQVSDMFRKAATTGLTREAREEGCLSRIRQHPFKLAEMESLALTPKGIVFYYAGEFSRQYCYIEGNGPPGVAYKNLRSDLDVEEARRLRWTH